MQHAGASYGACLMVTPRNEPGDPIMNAIFGTMCDDIHFLLDNERPISAVILIFSAIDAMSHLGRPKNKPEADGNDFQEWVERYFRVSGETIVKPLEWWAARCAIIHTYGAYSRSHKKSGVRLMTWITGETPGTRVHKVDGDSLLCVNVKLMYHALRSGIEKFFIDVCKDNTKKAIVEKRLRELLQAVRPAGSVKQFLDKSSD